MKKLKAVLLINAISSGFTGALLITLSNAAAGIFGVTGTTPFIAVGAFLVVFALYVYSVAKKEPANENSVRFIIALDIAWVLASLLAIILLHATITFIGSAAISAIALWVGGMAYLQSKGLKAGKSNSVVI